MHILPNKTFFCQKQPRKVTPTKIFFLNNRAYMSVKSTIYRSTISEKYLKRESLVTFLPNKKRKHSNDGY
jgi:hypothetical protein